MSTSKVTVSKFADLKARREPITVVTAYDATMARLFDEAEVEGLMVGDSLGMVIQGHDTTLPVTLDEMIYHTRCVSRGKPRAHVIGDLPFLSYQTSVRDAVCSAGRLVKEGGAESVKLEGGVRVKDAVRRIVDAGIPVMGHIGLTPQSVHQMGGFKVQGRGDEARRRCLEDADALVEAGVFSLVIEGVPSVLADEITSRVPVPTIGIGAGPGTDGQVLVCYDLLGMYRGLSPKFVRRFAEAGETIVEAARSYVRAVKLREFPAQEHTFQDVPAKATERAAYGGAPADPKNDP